MQCLWRRPFFSFNKNGLQFHCIQNAVYHALPSDHSQRQITSPLKKSLPSRHNIKAAENRETKNGSRTVYRLINISWIWSELFFALVLLDQGSVRTLPLAVAGYRPASMSSESVLGNQ